VNFKTSATDSQVCTNGSSINHGLMKNVDFFLYPRKQAKMQWVHDPNQSHVDNLNNVTCEASRHYRNKKKEYLKAKTDELETNNKIQNIRDLYRGLINFK
jgi:hypothetical protein